MANVMLNGGFFNLKAPQKSLRALMHKAQQQRIKDQAEAQAAADKGFEPVVHPATKVPRPAPGTTLPPGMPALTPEMTQTYGATQAPVKSESGLSKLIVPGAIALGAVMMLKGK